jgi:peptidoglycan/xylan/chitin deacetylase (PgdA/CDA1 family)
MSSFSSLESSFLRTLGSLLAPGGARGSLLVLIYHRVLEQRDPLIDDEPDAATFAAEMDLIGSLCNVLPLQEAVDRLASGSLPPRAACITFDDGYANNRTVAAPILHARRMPATVFVATGFIGDDGMFNDTVIEAVRCAGERLDLSDLGLGEFVLSDLPARRKAIGTLLDQLKYGKPVERMARAQQIAERAGVARPRGLMMTEQQIRELDGFGCAIGAHTVTHPILKSVDADEAAREIAQSKETLEAITGRPVTLFAYPNGRPNQDYDSSHVGMVRGAGFKAAVSTAWGAAARGGDLFQIPRMLPWDKSRWKFAARLLRTYREQRAETAAA